MLINLQKASGDVRILQKWSNTESVLVCGCKIQGVFKEYSSTRNRVFKGNSKQVYFVLNYDLNFAICHYQIKIAAADMKSILIKRKP